MESCSVRTPPYLRDNESIRGVGNIRVFTVAIDRGGGWGKGMIGRGEVGGWEGKGRGEWGGREEGGLRDG